MEPEDEKKITPSWIPPLKGGHSPQVFGLVSWDRLSKGSLQATDWVITHQNL
jgi:hypothetical protein